MAELIPWLRMLSESVKENDDCKCLTYKLQTRNGAKVDITDARECRVTANSRKKFYISNREWLHCNVNELQRIVLEILEE